MPDVSSKPFLRPRFDPVPCKDAPATTQEYDEIKSLPDLIHYNAKNNKEAIFCKQATLDQDSGGGGGFEKSGGQRYAARKISYGEISSAVNICVAWMTRALPISQFENGKPVALYMESDVGLFIHLAGLMELGIPVSILFPKPVTPY